MRIVHLADTHLGYRQFARRQDPGRKINQREADVYDVWHRAVDIAIELRPDAVIHAGDLFDSAYPSPRALTEALDGLARLRAAAIPTIVIAGNHSTPRFRSGGSVFEILRRFGVEAVWNEPATVIVGGLAVHAVPHRSDSRQLAEAVEELPPRPDTDANVLLLHAGLEGIKQGYGEVNEVALDPGQLARANYDYLALGHLHRFQTPQANAAYPGSLERLDFADLEGEKAVLEVDLSAGSPVLRRHPIETRRVLDVHVPCDGLDAGELLLAARSALPEEPLDGAVLRLCLDGISREAHHALDHRRLDELLEQCLHYVLRVSYGTGETPAPDGTDSFASFARERMPRGVDRAAVVELATRFLDEAADAEALEASG